jgi:hypothetical protein
MSPTHDYIVSNASGAAVRQDLNNALAAIVSNNSNATEPATTYAYQWWADTTAGQLKLRNATNDGWNVISDLDGGNFMQDGTAALPGLPFENDLNTGFFRPAADQLGISTNGVERVEFGTTEVVFNDDGADVDFRVEGDTEANLLYVDAGNEHVGIAEAAPGTVLEIGSTEPYVTLKNSTEEDTDGGRESRLIFEGEQSGGEISTLAQIEVSHDGTADDEKGKIVISTNDGSDGALPTAAITIDSTQQVGIGNTPAVALDVTGEIRASTGILFGTDTAAANTLDDYEEGTFTPRFKTDNGEMTGATYLIQSGEYTKVGNIVTFNLRVKLTTKGTIPAGNLQVAGLPYSCKNVNSTFGATATVGFCGGWNVSIPRAGFLPNASSEFFLYADFGSGTTNAGVYSAFSDGILLSGSDILLSGSYPVD